MKQFRRKIKTLSEYKISLLLFVILTTSCIKATFISERLREQKNEAISPLIESIDYILEYYPHPVSDVQLAESAIKGMFKAARTKGIIVPESLQNDLLKSCGNDVKTNQCLKDAFEKLLGLDTHIKQDELLKAGIIGSFSCLREKSIGLLTEKDASFYKNIARERISDTRKGILGIKLDFSSHVPTIGLIHAGFPAQKAGLKEGDIIISIDGSSVKTMSPDQVISLLKGPSGEAVRIDVIRPQSGKKLNFTIVRASEAEYFVAGRIVEPGIGLIQIKSFEGRGIAITVEREIIYLISKGVKGFILDLRNNSGGYPEESNAVADLFLSSGIIRMFQFKGGRKEVYKAVPPAYSFPLVVLVNEKTASSAEALAVALRDNNRATLIGARTYGKLGARAFVTLSNRWCILIPVSIGLSPRGIDYNTTGVEPDVLVPGDSAQDRQLEKAVQYMWEVLLSKPAKGIT